MSSAISSLTTSATVLSSATNAAGALGNLILVTPSQTKGYQPQNPPNDDGTPSTATAPPSFLFDYEGEQSVTLESDITDHYIEDNSAIQDQIALRPVIISTQGYVSELNDIVPSLLAPVKLIANTLVTVGAYAPGLSITAQVAYNDAFQLYQVAINAKNSAISAWSSITGGQNTTVLDGEETDFADLDVQSNQTKQQTAFQLFYGYWITRTLFTVQTPWAIFQNMAIKTLRPIQSEETNSISTFECSFKQIRTAQTSLTPPQSAVSQGRLASQSSALTNQGVSTPPSSISLDTGLSGPTSAGYQGAFPTVV